MSHSHVHNHAHMYMSMCNLHVMHGTYAMHVMYTYAMHGLCGVSRM